MKKGSNLLKKSNIKCECCHQELPIGRVEFIKRERLWGHNKPFLCIKCQEKMEEEEELIERFRNHYRCDNREILYMVEDILHKKMAGNE